MKPTRAVFCQAALSGRLRISRTKSSTMATTFVARNKKIVKEKGQQPDELEDAVAQVRRWLLLLFSLFGLQHQLHRSTGPWRSSRGQCCHPF
jgi:hypothetical protein